MTRVFLVRHGETVQNIEHRYSGSTDVPLSEVGKSQAAQLATWASGAKLDAIWSSTASRARDTADVCARASGITPRSDQRLVELDFGAAEGLTADEIVERWPGVFEAFRRDPVQNHLPDGEHPEDAIERFCDGVFSAAETSSVSRLLIVCHSTILRLGLCKFLGLPPSEYRRLFPVVMNCALTELSIDAGSVSLLRFNAPTDTRTK